MSGGVKNASLGGWNDGITWLESWLSIIHWWTTLYAWNPNGYRYRELAYAESNQMPMEVNAAFPRFPSYTWKEETINFCMQSICSLPLTMSSSLHSVTHELEVPFKRLSLQYYFSTERPNIICLKYVPSRTMFIWENVAGGDVMTRTSSPNC